MTPLNEILSPDHVILSLGANDREEAIEEVLSELNGDPRVLDFEALEKSVKGQKAPAIVESGVGICLAHGRTDAVSELVMAAGRSPKGVVCGDVVEPVRLVFVAGIPAAFNAEYLRIVGVLARVCRDRTQVNRILAARTGEEFVKLLHAGEVKL